MLRLNQAKQGYLLSVVKKLEEALNKLRNENSDLRKNIADLQKRVLTLERVGDAQASARELALTTRYG